MTGGREFDSPLSCPFRVLVVDDYEPFRDLVRSTLRAKADLQVIAEAGDGGRATELAEALQPDIILLDIGLPDLNGIKVARRIAELASKSRIIFVTQESSPEVIREALDLGAAGYVMKTDAGSELLLALKDVLQGKRFLSSGVDGKV